MYVRIVLLAILAAPAGASSVSAYSAAQEWLQSHSGAPDELAELKSANPEAFAIVNALLTKRSLGLLNNKHPTASLTDSEQHPTASLTDSERGPQAFANLASPGEIQAARPAHAMLAESAAPQVELPYANVKSSHHDWLNWKPKASGADEAMVANVLGMVGGMKGAAAASEPEPSAPAVTESLSETSEAVAAPVATESAPQAVSSGWGSIGAMLGLKKKTQKKAVPQVASYDAPSQPVFRAPAREQAVVQKPAQQDWNAVEKMKQNNDDKAVSSLLNMVAQLKGKKADKLLKKHHVEENALAGDLAAWGDNTEEASSAPVESTSATEISAPVIAPAAIAQPSAPVVPEAAPEKESSWGSIGGMLGVHKKPHHVAAPVETAPASASSSKWLNWRPKASGADEAMVANVLGMVGMKGAPQAPAAEAVPAPVEAPVAETVTAPVDAPAPEAVTPRAVPQAQAQDKDEKAVNSLLNMVAQLKGGKAAEKLLRKHHSNAEESSLSSEESTLFSAPAATPVAEPSAPAQDSSNSWGSIGGMLGVREKAKPVQTPQPQAPVERLPAGGMPAEVEALVSGKDEPAPEPVHQTQQVRKSDDYKGMMNKKQDADETAVKSLLGMVAQLKGGRSAEKLAEKYDNGNSEENSLSNDMASFSVPAPEAPAAEEVQQPRPQAQSEDTQRQAAAEELVKEEVPVQPAAPAKKKNLFLDSLTASIGGPKPSPHHVAALPKQKSYLSSFSWDDSEEDQADLQEKKPMMHPRVNDKLLSWLDPEQQQARVAAVAKQPQAPVNPYLVDLSD